MTWFYVERGNGRPLVLLHGIGMSHAAWAPVLNKLAGHRRVIAFDIAGFGQTPALPSPLTADAFVDGLRQSLNDLGINEPVDIVGNSMGGWLALEAAKAGLARSVVGISPAGLGTHDDVPTHIRLTFSSMRSVAKYAPGISNSLLKSPLVRALAMSIPVSIRSFRMPSFVAQQALQDFANAPGFDETLEIIKPVRGIEHLDMPITIAFGRLDWILIGEMQKGDRLPAHSKRLKPWGWGHVPMWDDPAGVAKVILEGTA
ncbi:MAG: alpha/beta hydrolase [Moraxellaceae bacterium]|nr:alpha/beta hydrolase [Moraxellaceae bacterium]MDP1774995.1 alpha/beta hydrolase [Moraxellaceae bacterium]